ncbi:hypothetical protein Vi05172_g652 [Venturia inaequalis]|nr:hypothetical protein Vi05172_g652 [Venturia inaequalis]
MPPSGVAQDCVSFGHSHHTVPRPVPESLSSRTQAISFLSLPRELRQAILIYTCEGDNALDACDCRHRKFRKSWLATLRELPRPAQMPKRSPSPSLSIQQPSPKCPCFSRAPTATTSDTTSSLTTAKVLSPTILTLPPEIRQKILLLCYDDRHEQIAKRLATSSKRCRRADTYDVLQKAVVKTEWSFQVWLNGSVQTAAPMLANDIEHVGMVVRERQERICNMLRDRRSEQLWVG